MADTEAEGSAVLDVAAEAAEVLKTKEGQFAAETLAGAAVAAGEYVCMYMHVCVCVCTCVYCVCCCSPAVPLTYKYVLQKLLLACAGTPERGILEDALRNLLYYKRNGTRYGFSYSTETMGFAVQLLIACGRTQYRRLASVFMLPSQSTAQKSVSPPFPPSLPLSLSRRVRLAPYLDH